ncbi:GGDEF domain-containing protein [Legionella shakespearei]|uniref:GGDEF/EAL domain-containing sensory box protein n=1 Tax=Legionella shakespearei DSM 23087 TaxID=1122169 RepID=A0A0W0YVP0_9GAMM|nr:GGDEF domain-containing protein [Legionella shakespearei]KTD60884.1 GGDEF/EAL domain-containing sensory box protein [Legionella shakespearei DSM 23087]
MPLFSKRPSRRQEEYDPAIDEYNRKYRLLHTLTLELLVLGVAFTYLNIYLNFWFVSYLLFAGSCIALGNLILLNKGYNIELCSHVVNTLCLIMMTIGNLWLGGISNSYIGWFYVSPIIAAATIGINGLIFYGFLSAALIFFFVFQNIPPLYPVPVGYLSLLNAVNHFFIFLLIFTTLYNLLFENKRYESLLKEKNFLLHSDKQKFHYLSNHDSLTNLPNRSYFNSHLQHLIDTTDTTCNSITLYFMDLDGFKKINDQSGHEIGDMLLLQAGKRLQNCFRENDFIARLGGDEFTAIILHNPNDTVAESLIQRIDHEFQQPFMIKGQEIKCTISTGMANCPADTLYADTLIKMADEAMYQNKRTKYASNPHH